MVRKYRQFINMSGMSNIFDNDDSVPGTSFGGMPASHGHPSFTSQPRSSPPTSPSETSRPLKNSLEELYMGAVKRLKVGRRLLNGGTENKVLEIQIQPGWKSGTKIRFPKAGNEAPGGDPQDLVFVVEEKPHSRFTRDDNDLSCTLEISLVDALTGGTGGAKRTVETLDGRKLQVKVPTGIVKPGQKTTIVGEGMPIRKDGSVSKKGDLIIQWTVVFPDRLTQAQQEGLKKILG
jgi:DnaJ family protein B protein 4